jgi:hypothetical protein
MNENIFYIVEIKTSTCSRCGKTIKNIYRYNGQDYGYECFKQILGINPTSKKYNQKPLPKWIYELLNKYVDLKKDEIEENKEDFEVNFWNECDKIGYTLEYPIDGGVYESSITMNSKKIPLYWQYEISKYLCMRHEMIINNINPL